MKNNKKKKLIQKLLDQLIKILDLVQENLNHCLNQ